MSVTTHLTRQKALMALLSVALFLLAIGVQKAQPPDESNAFAPSFKIQGSLGETIALREGNITFSNLRVAKSIQTGDGFSKKSLTTSGLWLVVDYTFMPQRDSGYMNVSLQTPDHTTYRTSLRGGVSGINGEPGFKEMGTIPFEVRRSAATLSGARLLVGNTGAFGVPLWDTEGIVPLGIDDARAARLVRDAPATLTVSE
ncbi:MAG: hypothetical protein GEV10_02280 [Streptosporangiales bacterium]|nr:hypothetical protein [Streptosporangiales bacterium]